MIKLSEEEYQALKASGDLRARLIYDYKCEIEYAKADGNKANLNWATEGLAALEAGADVEAWDY